jgi:uncharacterized protein YcbK (DUF882 family)
MALTHNSIDLQQYDNRQYVQAVSAYRSHETSIIRGKEKKAKSAKSKAIQQLLTDIIIDYLYEAQVRQYRYK